MRIENDHREIPTSIQPTGANFSDDVAAMYEPYQFPTVSGIGEPLSGTLEFSSIYKTPEISVPKPAGDTKRSHYAVDWNTGQIGLVPNEQADVFLADRYNWMEKGSHYEVDRNTGHISLVPNVQTEEYRRVDAKGPSRQKSDFRFAAKNRVISHQLNKDYSIQAQNDLASRFFK